MTLQLLKNFWIRLSSWLEYFQKLFSGYQPQMLADKRGFIQRVSRLSAANPGIENSRVPRGGSWRPFVILKSDIEYALAPLSPLIGFRLPKRFPRIFLRVGHPLRLSPVTL